MLNAGNKLEDLMHQLCSRHIDYDFAAITEHTTKLAQIMQDCSMHSVDAQYQVHLPAIESVDP